MAKPVTLPNGKSWKTKSAAQAHFKEMLGRYKNKEKVSVLEDHADLAALLELYDRDLDRDESTKGGTGIQYFLKDRDMENPGNTSCFHVMRADNTVMDFSYRKAIDSASRLSAS